MPLKVLVVGAGPVGLTTAIALAAEGHEVELFEKSAFSHEIGAAMQLTPQIVGLLKNLGISVEDLNGRPCRRWNRHTDLSMDGRPTPVWEWSERAAKDGLTEPMVMVHRVDAHDALRNKAMSFSNVHLHLSSPIASVNVQGSITTQDGQTYTGDLVVGADGVHSVVIEALIQDGEDVSLHYGPMNIYRFMVPSNKLSSDPLVAKFFDEANLDWHNSLNSFRLQGRFLIVYPCRQTSLLNCVTILRRDLDLAPIEAGIWHTPGSKSDLDAALEGMPPHIRGLVNMAEDIKHWTSVTRHSPRTYVQGRVVVVGDASHAMPPAYSAGAGTGIEDACVLATILNNKTAPSEVESLLCLYNELRYERGTIIKYASHINMEPDSTQAKTLAKLQSLVPGAQVPPDMWGYIWKYDGVSEAKEAMVKHRSSE